MWNSRMFWRKIAYYISPAKSFRARLILAFALETVISCGIMLVVATVWSYNAQRSTVLSNLGSLSNQAVALFDRVMFERLRELQLASTTPTFASSTNYNTTEAQQYIESMKSSYSDLYAWIGVVGTDAIVKVSTGNVLLGFNTTARPFRSVCLSGGIYFGDVHLAALLTNLISNSTDVPYVTVAVPIRNLTNNDTIGCFLANVYWSWVASEVEESILQCEDSIEMLVLNKTYGILLNSSSPNYNQELLVTNKNVQAQIDSGQQTFEADDWDGVNYLVGSVLTKGYLSFPGLGWIVVLRQSKTAALSAIVEARDILIIVGIALTLLFSITGWLVASQVVKPIMRIVASADGILKGIDLNGNQVETDLLEMEGREADSSRHISVRILPKPNSTLQRRRYEEGDVNILLESLENLSSALKSESELRRQKKALERGIRDQTAKLEEVISDQQIIQDILSNTLPDSIIERLKRGEKFIAEQLEDVTMFFSDIVGFTTISSSISPLEVVTFLNEIFTKMDQLAGQYDVEKIKTIGDAYFGVGGLFITTEADSHEHRRNVATQVLNFSLDVIAAIEDINNSGRYPSKFQLRIGVNTGPVIAGIIANKKFAFDLWGDAVNVASRMESTGTPGRIQVNRTTYKLTKGNFEFVKRGQVKVKGKGDMITYWLIGNFQLENQLENQLEID
eukprot:TRINITY_DN6463_c1_g1_i2.p1 TRINITY_DN6463_c1_g1~~TRINITY_DN6463_c1_g1_i2.p1  ORF type:complete len:678 (-),score=138.54 TRINITY_DN6463_c1_g1_i2:68-2101(-)